MKTLEKTTGHIYTVSNLTREIKSLLEDRFPFLWVTGEISNYAQPASGHSYFSLKDVNAVISCVMFKNQKRNLKFNLETGMKVVGLARISLYEPRGSYQLIFEHLEPEGSGSLQIAFEQLKKKLASQGLFDESHKNPIPFLPLKINVITSSTGAAVRDIIHVAERRFPGCYLEILPVKVQGETAESEIVSAIEIANTQCLSDLIILARGGGSIEDLSAFNSKEVAMAVFESRIPVITGIGHETDFTIADFVADLRAPTPSAAAEMALPDKAALIYSINTYKVSLSHAMSRKLAYLHQKLDDFQFRLKSPGRMVDDFRFRIEECENRMVNSIRSLLLHRKEQISWLKKALEGKIPETRELTKHIHGLTLILEKSMESHLSVCKTKTRELNIMLENLNPSAILDRGYAIPRILPGKKVIKDANDAVLDDRIELILSKGRLITQVVKKTDGKENI
ncbi:MAG: exodeoxyribonuclease VII large subunit [Desulfobacteraceae bacterium 4572_89]|nr:MAG: exodeoxyribonuclease VII large subunit [Desulfobacteraceae bacterium 4572_89]